MFEAVTARPAGRSTLSRLALTAAQVGYEGIVVRNPGNRLPTDDHEAIRARYDIDIVDGVEIVAEDRTQASGFLGSHRPERTIVVVRGGTNALNRFAAEHAAVDVLADPFGLDPTDERSPSGGVEVDHVLAKTAADNGVRIEFSLAPILRDSGGSRVRAIQSLRKLRTLVEQYDTPYVLTAGPDDHLGIRNPRDLAALGDGIGFSQEGIERGLEEWQALAERNRQRRDASFVEPGVRRCDDE